jgi:hypothetical protein
VPRTAPGDHTILSRLACIMMASMVRASAGLRMLDTFCLFVYMHTQDRITRHHLPCCTQAALNALCGAATAVNLLGYGALLPALRASTHTLHLCAQVIFDAGHRLDSHHMTVWEEHPSLDPLQGAIFNTHGV